MAEATYFTDGDAYERFMGRWSRAAGEQFIDWLSLPPGLKWLDVGCGTGAFTELVLSRCAPSKIDAIDPAEDQISYARNRPGTGRAAYRVGDAQSLPYADGEFDVAVMALVINFIPNPAKAVAEMARVLKPGGTAATYAWDVLNNGFVQQPLRDAIAAMNVPMGALPGMDKTTPDAMRGYFEGAGLGQVTTRAIAIEVTYDSFDDYWASQTGHPNPAVQALRNMAEPDVARLKAGLRERLADGNGRVAYPARLNAIKGRLPG